MNTKFSVTMKPAYNMILLAVAFSAAGIFVFSRQKGGSAPTQPVGDKRPLKHRASSQLSSRSSFPDSRNIGNPTASAMPDDLPVMDAGSTHDNSVAEPESLNDLTPQQRAQMVEHAANHTLRKMTRQLDLTPQQQEAIFPMLARSQPAWMPGMSFAATGRGAAVVNTSSLTPTTTGSGTSSTPNSATTPATGSSTPPSTTSSPAPETTAANPDLARITREQMTAEITKLLLPRQRAAFLKNQLSDRLWWNETMSRIAFNALRNSAGDTSATPALPEKRGGRPNTIPSLQND